MTVQAVIDGGRDVFDVATNSGWATFAGSLQQNAQPDSELSILGNHGWSQQPKKLRQELEALKFDQPDLESVKNALLSAVDVAREVVIVNDGSDGGPEVGT